MAKKQRTVRPPRSADMSRYGHMSTPTGGTAPTTSSDAGVVTTGKGTQPAAAKLAAETNYAAEYRYVASDLRRIALLAGAMFALLIVLSFVVG